MRAANAIEIEGLRKEYRRLRGGKLVALERLDLQVEAGGVFGFLGPNGSGKTTTIRCLLGLVAPDAGRCRLLGRDIATELPSAIRVVGSLVEAPALFPTFSGTRNLELLARMYRLPRSSADRALRMVGLEARADDLVKTYSLGMRQRLGIAAALLKDPELLILDEPANGLDPAGIKEVRELLRRLGDEGRTVFVSSHQLSEVQQTCDRVAILAGGRCITTGPVDEVLQRRQTTSMLVRVENVERARSILSAAGLRSERCSDLLRVHVPASDGARISYALAQHGVYVSELRGEEVDLETVFLELTNGVEAA